MSLIFATQLTAIATAVLAAFAIVTALYARRAFAKQSQEVSDQAAMLKVQAGQLEEQRKLTGLQTPVLELQAAELRESIDERKREAEQRRRAQAYRVFITQEPGRTAPRGHPEPEGAEQIVTATVVNSSDQPVYDAEIRWHLGPGAHGGPDPIGTIMPGAEASRMRLFPVGADMSTSGAYVRFTDANGARWLRRPDGYLDEIPQT